MTEIIQFPKEKSGAYSLWDLPQGNPLEESTFSTGWWELDQIFKFYPGQFVVVTGLAGHGKSTFVLNMICQLGLENYTPSFLYVPENERGLRAKMRKLWRSDDESFENFAKNYCFVQSSNREGSAYHTMDWVLAQAHKEFESQGSEGEEIIVIDPWNELDRAKPKDMLLTDYIGWCLMEIKDFCRSTNRTVIVIAHPTKAVAEAGGRVATLADIEGSMNWFNKCDNGLIVVRDDKNSSAKVISAKVRHEPDAGRRGECHFHVDAKTGIFTPMKGAVTP